MSVFYFILLLLFSMSEFPITNVIVNHLEVYLRLLCIRIESKMCCMWNRHFTQIFKLIKASHMHTHTHTYSYTWFPWPPCGLLILCFPIVYFLMHHFSCILEMILFSTLLNMVEKTKKLLDPGWKFVKRWINIFTFSIMFEFSHCISNILYQRHFRMNVFWYLQTEFE